MDFNIFVMTAKEKAKELVDKFKYRNLRGVEIEAMSISLAKQCALICVNEIIIQLNEGSSLWVFWVDVKHEIEKL